MNSLTILEQTGPFMNVDTPDDAVAARIEDHLNNLVNQYPAIIDNELVAQRLRRLNICFVRTEPDAYSASRRKDLDLRYVKASGVAIRASIIS